MLYLCESMGAETHTSDKCRGQDKATEVKMNDSSHDESPLFFCIRIKLPNAEETALLSQV